MGFEISSQPFPANEEVALKGLIAEKRASQVDLRGFFFYAHRRATSSPVSTDGAIRHATVTVRGNAPGGPLGSG
jgi:hypothetical protein